jgi:hypothetical protein
MIKSRNKVTRVFYDANVQGRLTRDIEPVLLAYLASGVVLAILQILAIVLSSAYCAVLSRRAKKNNDDPIMSSLLGGKPRPHDRHLELYNLTATGGTLANATDSGVPSTRDGSRRSVLEGEDDIVSTASSSRHGINYRSSLHVEPSQETGTVI